VDSYNLFFQLCSLGALIQALILVLAKIASPSLTLPAPAAIMAQSAVIAINGASFFAYLQVQCHVM
jgi:hypothetical protein